MIRDGLRRCAFVVALISMGFGTAAYSDSSYCSTTCHALAEDDSCDGVQEPCALNALQHGALKAISNHKDNIADDSVAPSKCASLVNHGTHFTVDIDVGTPAQKFSVIADTGSNSLIVPSCICNDAHRCHSRNRCFRGTNHSSTFLLDKFEDKGPLSMVITFGSGQVKTVLASDVARLGGVEAKMHDSLLLMTDQALRISGAFEGILGLGLPRPNSTMTLSTGERNSTGRVSAGEIPQIIHKIMKGMKKASEGSDIEGITADSALMISDRRAGDDTSGMMDLPDDVRSALTQQSNSSKDQVKIPEPKGFLEEAGISRFSMCFKDGANGTLQLDTPPMQNALESIGHYHWGLDLRGVSLGNTTVPICSQDSMKEGQLTACGAIPDSGTTAIMAPKKHVELLVDSICDAWDRCRENHTALVNAREAASKAAAEKYGFDPFGLQKVKLPKSKVVDLLLQDCGSWLTKEHGLNELPPVDFQVAGKSGAVQRLEMPGWTYVMKTKLELVERVYKNFGPLGMLPVGVKRTGKFENTCMLGFSSMEYNTKVNGPVWIFGTSFFYQYQVAYDLNPDKPSIAFTSVKDSPCNECGGPSLVETGAHRQRASALVSLPREVQGPWRVPNLNIEEPL